MKILSIIIPVYNVETYIEECLEHIVKQEFDTNKVEVLIVNDGSTDNSNVIIDQYIEKYNYFIKINKVNGGVSSARNLGLKYSKGKYILFLDGDDYLTEKSIGKILNILSISNSKLYIYNYNEVYESGNLIKNKFIDSNCKDNIRSYLLQDIKNYSWNKIYLKSLFKNIKFPESEIYEDMIVTLKIIIELDKIEIIQEELYNYRIRETSLSRIHNEKNIKDYIKNFNICCKLLKEKKYDLKYRKEFDYYCCINNNNILSMMYSKKLKRKDFEKFEEINIFKMLFNNRLSSKSKILNLMLRTKIYRIYRMVK